MVVPGTGEDPLLPSYNLSRPAAARCSAASQTARSVVSFSEESTSMHELSIAASIVESVTESAATYPGARVKEVRLRVGALASVVEDSLQFCWEHCHGGHAAGGRGTGGQHAARDFALRCLAAQDARNRRRAEFSLSAMRRAGGRSAPGPRTGDRIRLRLRRTGCGHAGPG